MYNGVCVCMIMCMEAFKREVVWAMYMQINGFGLLVTHVT